jgi:hypothetical protein
MAMGKEKTMTETEQEKNKQKPPIEIRIRLRDLMISLHGEKKITPKTYYKCLEHIKAVRSLCSK